MPDNSATFTELDGVSVASRVAGVESASGPGRAVLYGSKGARER